MTTGFGIYVHLPWCVQKCPYCDFNSHGLRNDALPEDAYVDALERDIALEAGHIEQHGNTRAASSVFFGGGTPSLFSARAIGRILDRINTEIGLSADAEVTLEANPGAVEHGSFTELRAAGVNRLSLGAQSFDDHALATLGRVHRAQETVAAVQALRAAGFDNFNLDLMYALPDQTLEQAQSDLEQALDLEPSHLSHYQLTLEPNTLFYQKPPSLPDDDSAWEMHQSSLARLAERGFDQYEVSAYARDGLSSRHNTTYWRFGDYVGVGAGAHGKLTHREGHVERSQRTRHPAAYMATDFDDADARGARRVSEHDLCFEYPLNVLRLKNEPLRVTEFERLTGVPATALQPSLDEAIGRGLLHKSREGRYDKTELGWRFLNDLQAQFLVPEQ